MGEKDYPATIGSLCRGGIADQKGREKDGVRDELIGDCRLPIAEVKGGAGPLWVRHARMRPV
jgi:hypothetical protein